MVSQIKFSQSLLEGGAVVLPSQFLENIERLNISPENLGYLVLALSRCRNQTDPAELARDKWIKWALSAGWAQWQKEGESKKVTFAPLWARLYSLYEKDQTGPGEQKSHKPGEFDYGKILKWLDHERGTLSITLREKQVVQEMNLKYGWTTEFILIFLQLAFERGLNKLYAYEPVAKRVYENGVDSVNDLVSFMNDLDWIQYKVAEVKKCIGQYGGVTRPQREMYLKWNKQWKLGHELIMRASEETVRTNSPSFKYIDAILKDWHEQGVGDIAAAEKALALHDQNRSPQPKPNAAGVKTTGAKRYSKTGNRDLNKLYGLE